MKRLLFTIFLILIFLLPVWAGAADYYIYSGGSATAPYDTWAKAANTLAQINAVSLTSGDHQIYLRAGEDFAGTLQSTNWTDGVDSITISGVNEDLSDATGTDRPRILGAEASETGGNGNIWFTHIGVNKSITIIIEDIQIVDQDYYIDTNVCAIMFRGPTGVTIDGVLGDGEVNTTTDSPTAIYNGFIAIDYPSGNIEIKNSTIQYWGPPCLWASPEVPSGGESYTHVDLNGIFIKCDTAAITISIHDNTIKNVDGDGIQVEHVNDGGQTSIYNNTIYNCGENAIDWKFSTDLDFYNNVVYRDATFTGLGGSSYSEDVKQRPLLQFLADDSSEITAYSDVQFRDNYLGPTDTSAIGFREVQTAAITLTNFKIFRNWITDVHYGFYMFGNGIDGVEVYNNIIDGIKTGGNFVWEETTLYADPTANYYHHNTFYSNADMGIGIYFNSSASHLYNNIIYMNDADSYMMDQDGNGTYSSMLFDGNIWYNANAGDDDIIRWDGATVYDESELTAWKARAEVGASEKFENPDMVAPATDEFWGDAAEDACVNGGVVAAQTDIPDSNNGLKSDSTWTPAFSINTVARTDNNGPDVGAYEFKRRGVIIIN